MAMKFSGPRRKNYLTLFAIVVLLVTLEEIVRVGNEYANTTKLFGTIHVDLKAEIEISAKKRKPDVGHKYLQNLEQICGSKWQKRYSAFHENALKDWKSKGKGNFLVYDCKNDEVCGGGYGNRIRALTSLFYLALLTNRVFLIDWRYPSRLDNYLETNGFSWNFAIDEGVQNYHEVFWGRQAHSSVSMLVERENMSEYFNHTVEVIQHCISTFFGQIQSNPFLRKSAEELEFPLQILDNKVHAIGCAFHFMFKLKSELNTELEKIMTMMGYNENIMLSIHARTGDFKTFRTISSDVRIPKSKYHRIFSCAKMIQLTIQKKFNTTNIAWFLASDSWDLKKYAEITYPQVQQYRGPIVHTGQATFGSPEKDLHDPRNPPGDGMRTVILEQFLMAKSDFFLHSWGSFGLVASSLALATSDYFGRLDSNFDCILPKKLDTYQYISENSNNNTSLA